jgi:hypothetical protein
MYSMLTGALARGSLILEAVDIETATKEVEVTMPVTTVTEGTAPEPDATVAPRSWWRHMLMRTQD